MAMLSRVARFPRLDDFAQQRPQVEAQALASHRQNLPGGRAGRCLQIFSGPRGVVDDIAIAVDDHVGRRELLKHLTFDGLSQSDAALGGVPRRWAIRRLTCTKLAQQ